MWSGRAPSIVSEPPATATAATYVAAWIRSGTVWCRAGRNEPGSTPSMTSVDVPIPEMFGAHRHEELAEVGDLGFTRGVVDPGRPLGEHGRRQQVLGRPDATGSRR